MLGTLTSFTSLKSTFPNKTLNDDSQLRLPLTFSPLTQTRIVGVVLNCHFQSRYQRTSVVSTIGSTYDRAMFNKKVAQFDRQLLTS